MDNFSKLDTQIISQEIKAAIYDLSLDFTHRKILTEAATGIFSITPIIAALAGAEKVYAITQNSMFGNIEEVKNTIIKWIKYFDINPKIIEIIEKNSFNHYKDVDIVTNTGHVRPIDRNMITKLNKRAVISYMCEAWEYRPGDINIEVCNTMNIPVAGINESHPHVDCFREVGLIALKQLIDAKISIFDKKVVILSRDAFGIQIKKILDSYCCSVLLENDFKNLKIFNMDSVDIIITADYLYPDEIIGDMGLILPKKLKKYFPDVFVIQYCGNNNFNDIVKENLNIYPNSSLPAFKMVETLAAISHKAVIRLHTGGLKVGQILFNAKHKNDKNILNNNLLQIISDFTI